MTKSIILNSMLVMAIALLTLTAMVTFSPKEAKASKEAKVVYMAGNKAEGSDICVCPAISGNCVCAIVLPD